MITYDSVFYHSELSVFKFHGMDAAPVPKGCPPKEVASRSEEGVSPVSALPRAMAAFSRQ